MAETTDTPILDLLASMTAGSIEASSLDPTTLMLVRIAALVAMDAPPVSYAFNLEAAGDLEIDAERVQGVLLAVAPIVGTAASLRRRPRSCGLSRSSSRSQSSRRRQRTEPEHLGPSPSDRGERQPCHRVRPR
jgi:hypothetical protein